MMRVALSGGIASGKTIVSNSLKDHGVPIIDTDILAREAVLPGTEGLQRIVERFGESILDKNNTLDRNKLRDIVFSENTDRSIGYAVRESTSDNNARQDLESILHPLIRQLADERLDALDKSTTPYAVVVIPLLVETGQQNSYDHVVIVDVDPEIQIKRLMARDNSTREQAERILASQASRKQRLAAADDVIFNSSTVKAVELQVRKIHEHLLRLAKKKQLGKKNR